MRDSKVIHHLPDSMKLLLWVRSRGPPLEKLLESHEFLVRSGLKTLGVMDKKPWVFI